MKRLLPNKLAFLKKPFFLIDLLSVVRSKVFFKECVQMLKMFSKKLDILNGAENLVIKRYA
jgi:hypothetical protein